MNKQSLKGVIMVFLSLYAGQVSVHVTGALVDILSVSQIACMGIGLLLLLDEAFE